MRAKNLFEHTCLPGSSSSVDLGLNVVIRIEYIEDFVGQSWTIFNSFSVKSWSVDNIWIGTSRM